MMEVGRLRGLKAAAKHGAGSASRPEGRG